MPTYEYQCDYFPEHRYEKLQKFSDPADTTCPICGHTVHRLISGGAGLIFHGNGFYQTDYKNNRPKENKSKKEETSDSKTETKSTGGCGANCGCH